MPSNHDALNGLEQIAIASTKPAGGIRESTRSDEIRPISVPGHSPPTVRFESCDRRRRSHRRWSDGHCLRRVRR
jgi:hypothetical protein